MKKCTGCRREKPLDQFHKRASAKDGHSYYCKACKAEAKSDYLKRKAEEMNKSRFQAVFNGLSSVAKKVYQHVSEDQYWTTARVSNELFRSGIKMAQSEVAGCLNTLVKAGLVTDASGTFSRVKVKEESAKLSIQEKEEKTMLTTQEPTQEKQSPVDKLLGISVKLGELSTFVTRLSNEITEAVEEVEHFVKENDEEMQKLQQLRSLLKSLG